MTHNGGCHCGRVRFEVVLPEPLKILSCNCSICSMNAFLHIIVPKDRFRLISGEEALTCYSFNTGVAKHLFCSRCGVKSFYVPRSNPDGISVNARCVFELDLSSLSVEAFDGQNWEDHAAALRHLSKPNLSR